MIHRERFRPASNRATITFVAILVSSGCDRQPATDPAIGSVDDREALVEYLIDRTMEREAFSPEKNRRLGLDVEASMRAEAEGVINATTQEELFYALVRLSNARKDRHLSVSPIEGGLQAPAYYPGSNSVAPIAPIRVEIDYSVTDDVVLFVSDVATDQDLVQSVMPGDRILAFNGVSPTKRFEQARPYMRYSTELGFRKKYTQLAASRTGLFPPALYRETLDLTLSRDGGDSFDVSLQYVDPAGLEWQSESEPRYPGYERVIDSLTYDLYLSESGGDIIILDWHRFNSTLVEDIDRLMQYAADNDLLTHDIVFDATRSGGGSLGAYAIQRLSPKPFKTTFGNLRISDVIPEFIDRIVSDYEANRDPLDSGGKETIDDGTWLVDWLTDDVRKAYDAGQEYSNNVPFKLAHAPKHSDGIIEPAEIHFQGNMVCLMGPNGGSHLDQFFAIVTDNELCDTIGMQTGGYSNTWEWHEDVVFPVSGKPVVEFMWNIGHTIAPSGRIVEGHPSELDETIPMTHENFANYDGILLDRAIEILADARE